MCAAQLLNNAIKNINSTFVRKTVYFKKSHHFWSSNKVLLRPSTKYGLSHRHYKTQRQRTSASTFYYISAVGVLVAGLSYAAVPLYRIFCQSYGYGGTTSIGHDSSKVESMKKIADRLITIKFNADVAASMTWNFKPQQDEVQIYPGETALAFYTATNSTDKQITGISTYNVIPFEAGQYFNKIQCFCFEEQMLNPHEQVDMPVFFYIDPEFSEDPLMESVDTVTLSYTFFEAKPGFNLPIPSYAK